MRQKKTQPFPLEKILTVSARDYCESVGKRLSDYEMRGVYGEQNYGIKDFANKVPTDTEIVVDHRPIKEHPYRIVLYGIALIPKTIPSATKHPAEIKGMAG